MRSSTWSMRAAAWVFCSTLCACAHLDVRLENFIAPDRGPATARLAAGYVVENHVLKVRGQSIGITYAHRPGSRAVVLYCGGDAFHRSLEGGVALQALALDADVALFDYPGYGDTSGSPGTAEILDTAVAVYDHIFGLDSTAGKQRILYGFSMGGMVAAHLSQDRRADGLVLEATAPTVARWAHSRIPLPLKPLVRVRIEPQLSGLDAGAALEQFHGKVMLLTSGADEMVPARLSRAMNRRLLRTRHDVRLVELAHCRHGAILRSPEFPSAMRSFLEHVRVMP